MSENRRLSVAMFLVILPTLIIITRLFFVQIVDGEEYRQIGGRQYSSSSGNEFNRGNIYFTDKDGNYITAATVKQGYKLAINPSLISNPSEVYKKLSSIIELDEEDFKKRVSRLDDPYEEIAHYIDQDTADEISELDIEGLALYREKWRIYPNGKMAANVLGFVGFNEDSYEGQYGIERQFDVVLKRESKELYSNFFVELFAGIKDFAGGSDAWEGDVVLTIEPTVQGFIEDVLDGLVEEWNPKQAGILVMDPVTGDIVSMAVYPSFDPNKYSEEEDISVLSNPMVESVYEMGSIIKPLTVSAGVDVEAITAETTYHDRGYVDIGESRIKNYSVIDRGVVNIEYVLHKSLNTGAVFAMQQIGKEKFREYFYKFGLAEKTGIELPNEATGITDNLETYGDVEYATASFGQGIALTPVETARALSAIANGGYLIKPKIVSKIEYTNSLSDERVAVDQGRVLKESTAKEITRMLTTLVDESLFEGTYKMDNYKVAVKTGTAQIAKPEGGGYYEDRYLHTYFGYFPASKPKFLILIYAKEPEGAVSAHQKYTEIFMEMANFLINYYEIPPDRI